jgi:hypothetical protein
MKRWERKKKIFANKGINLNPEEINLGSYCSHELFLSLFHGHERCNPFLAHYLI